MKVELKTILCGPAGGGQPGDQIEVDETHGKALIKGGYAVEVVDAEPEPVEPDKAPQEKAEEQSTDLLETATEQPEETAVSGERRKPRKPGGAK